MVNFTEEEKLELGIYIERVIQEEIQKIVSDEEYHEQSGKDKRTDEISPMCLVLLKLYKKNGTVWMKSH